MNSKHVTKDFDFNLMKVLDAVISAGNAVRASKRLQVTPAAVSLALQRLQSAYQDELFIRTHSGLSPTARAKDIHRAYRQALDIIDNTFEEPQNLNAQHHLKILGGELSEQYYFAHLFGFEGFERYRLRHFSARAWQGEEQRSMLISGEMDMLVTLDTVITPELDFTTIDSFRDYCVICSKNSPLAELNKLSLYNFYSASHAVYHSNILAPILSDKIELITSGYPYVGQRKAGYRTDSLSGLLCMVENSSLIAILPVKLVTFIQNQGKYNLARIALPDEFTFTTQAINAVWYKKSKNIEPVKNLTTMLRTLSAFRR